jgi:hypothetical protein
MKTKMKWWRWSAALLTAGTLLQAGSCAVDQETLAALINQVAVRQSANILSDVIFFLLDNALVRMTG